MVQVRKDLVGMRYGRLIVVSRAEDKADPNGKEYAYWNCLCDCGNEKTVKGTSLTTGNTKSCGCLQKELTSKARKGYNLYDLSGEYGIGYTSKGEEFWFDLEDYDKIKKYSWYKHSHGYIVSKSKEVVYLHRLVLDLNDSNIVPDHIHGKKSRYDNRKSNLRVATYSQNGMNSATPTNNSSGVTGVCWNSKRNKWESYIMINRKKKNLGRFNNFEDAVAVRKEAEEKYFGVYNYDYSQQLNKESENN